MALTGYNERMKLTLIIPTLNEAQHIHATLTPLQAWRAEGHEILLADGGSADETLALAAPLVDRVVTGVAGRARQMNAGARAAHGDMLLFLHADTSLPPNCAALIAFELQRSPRRWGRFDVKLDGRHPALRLVEHMMNLRSRLTGIATGDQAMFVARALFEQVGGFPEIELMEDIALSRTLKRHGRPLCLRGPVITSARRWNTQGIWRTVLLMWRLRLAYFLGADPARLARRYYHS